MWFPSNMPETNAQQLSPPPARPSPLNRAQRPHTSDLVRDEYYTQRAYSRYAALSEADGAHPLGAGIDAAQQQGLSGATAMLRTSHSLSQLTFLDERSPVRDGSNSNSSSSSSSSRNNNNINWGRVHREEGFRDDTLAVATREERTRMMQRQSEIDGGGNNAAVVPPDETYATVDQQDYDV